MGHFVLSLFVVVTEKVKGRCRKYHCGIWLSRIFRKAIANFMIMRLITNPISSDSKISSGPISVQAEYAKWWNSFHAPYNSLLIKSK